MEFTLTTRLEKEGIENILVVDVAGPEPFILGPPVPVGLRDSFDTWEMEGDCDPLGQPFHTTTISLGPVNCSDSFPVGAGVNVTIKKNGAENSKESKKIYTGSPLCT